MDQATATGSDGTASRQPGVRSARLRLPVRQPHRGEGLNGRRTLGPAFGGKRLRIAPWQGNRLVALVGPVRHGRRPSVPDVERCMAYLSERGVHRAVTPAMSALEAEPFHQAGFEHFEGLHLLACSLPRAGTDHLPALTADITLSTARPWHTDDVLHVDAQAFDGFWRFDQRALSEAKRATPSRHFRVARVGKRIVGYAITGRSGNRGYLQRLAVDPAMQGRGIGTFLINDGFRWLSVYRATTCMVNTQESNEGALALYERLGFRRQPQGLMVLQWNRDP